LTAVNRELDAFSYSVSHDLRAPVRAVDGFTRILEEDYGPRLDAEGRRLLGVVRTSMTRMGQ
jgi:light-regulated signal transduction histidine kinase (bacteriophytochrome)